MKTFAIALLLTLGATALPAQVSQQKTDGPVTVFVLPYDSAVTAALLHIPTPVEAYGLFVHACSTDPSVKGAWAILTYRSGDKVVTTALPLVPPKNAGCPTALFQNVHLADTINLFVATSGITVTDGTN